jgi:hypothetical protein
MNSVAQPSHMFGAFRNHRPALIGLIWISLLAVVAIAGPVIRPDASHHANAQDLDQALLEPGSSVALEDGTTMRHWLGTDRYGRDVLSRLMAKKGGRKDGDWAQRLNLGAGSWASANEPNNSSIEKSNFQLKSSDDGQSPPTLSPSERSELLTELRAEMETAAKSLDFEQAARLRDRIYESERMNE